MHIRRENRLKVCILGVCSTDLIAYWEGVEMTTTPDQFVYVHVYNVLQHVYNVLQHVHCTHVVTHGLWY